MTPAFFIPEFRNDGRLISSGFLERDNNKLIII